MKKELNLSRRGVLQAAGGVFAVISGQALIESCGPAPSGVEGNAFEDGKTAPKDGGNPEVGGRDTRPAPDANAPREAIPDAGVADKGQPESLSEKPSNPPDQAKPPESFREAARDTHEPAAPDKTPEPPGPDLEPPDLKGRKYVEVDLNPHPDMVTIGWYIDVKLPSDVVFLFRRSSTTLAAISITCTHQGCFVGWRSTQNRFVCPCHNGVYNREGQVVSGPPPSDLRQYPTAFDIKLNRAYIFLDR